MTDPADSRSLLQEIVTAVDSGDPVVLATVVETAHATPTHGGAKMLVYADGRSSGTVGGGAVEAAVTADALEAIEDERGRLTHYDLAELGMCPGELTVYLEPHLPPPTVLVLGCGHIGRAVVELAHWLGFRVVALDDRQELVTRKLLPDADELLAGPFAETLRRIRVTERTHVVVTTRNTDIDLELLPLLLATPAGSIGVLGSRRRWERTRTALLAGTVTTEQLERVKSPIGLDLGARTPREIALSILAELLTLRPRT